MKCAESAVQTRPSIKSRRKVFFDRLRDRGARQSKRPAVAGEFQIHNLGILHMPACLGENTEKTKALGLHPRDAPCLFDICFATRSCQRALRLTVDDVTNHTGNGLPLPFMATTIFLRRLLLRMYVSPHGNVVSCFSYAFFQTGCFCSVCVRVFCDASFWLYVLPHEHQRVLNTEIDTSAEWSLAWAQLILFCVNAKTKKRKNIKIVANIPQRSEMESAPRPAHICARLLAHVFNESARHCPNMCWRVGPAQKRKRNKFIKNYARE